MLLKKITLHKALQLESTGDILIYDSGSKYNRQYHPRAVEWQNNYNELRTKAPHIPIDRITQFYSAKYLIEISIGCIDKNTGTYMWKYLTGIPISGTLPNIEDNIEYVYILTNQALPGVLKIGVTKSTVNQRVHQLNSTGVLVPWEPKFALPVRTGKGFKIEKQVHKYFSQHRLHAIKQNDREMFQLDIFTAIDKIREVGSYFQAGNPIVF